MVWYGMSMVWVWCTLYTGGASLLLRIYISSSRLISLQMYKFCGTNKNEYWARYVTSCAMTNNTQ